MNQYAPAGETGQIEGAPSAGGGLASAARVCIIVLTVITVCAVLIYVKGIFAPVALALVVGLMFGPLEDWLEARRIPQVLSAAVVVLTFVGIIGLSIYFFSAPISEWIGRAPQVWERLQEQLANFQEPLVALSAFQEQLQSLGGEQAAVEVTVAEGNQVLDIAMHAPNFAAEALIFLASLYFYVATRQQIRHAILSLCRSPRLRWRVAHVFREIEHKISSFLFTVTLLNLSVGIAVGVSMWAVGLPSPVLWGALAFFLNYIPYVGQGAMMVLLLAAGIGTQDGLMNMLLPLAFYLAINFAEGQIITPHVLGHRMTVNPFLIFFATAIGLWAWGPIGGAISVPMLLIGQAVLSHVLPRSDKEVHDVQKRLTAAVFQRNAAEAEHDGATDPSGA